jgi:hypothetical protein
VVTKKSGFVGVESICGGFPLVKASFPFCFFYPCFLLFHPLVAVFFLPSMAVEVVSLMVGLFASLLPFFPSVLSRVFHDF